MSQHSPGHGPSRWLARLLAFVGAWFVAAGVFYGVVWTGTFQGRIMAQMFALAALAFAGAWSLR